MTSIELRVNKERIHILREIVSISKIESKKLSLSEVPNLDINSISKYLNEEIINQDGLIKILDDFGKKLCEKNIVNCSRDEKYSDIAIEFLETHININLHNV